MQPSSVEELDDMYQILDSAWKAQPLGELLLLLAAESIKVA